jgi:Ca2+-binding EF-hand superfamily protein
VAGTDEYAPTFALMDTDQDGLITAGEFKQLLDLLGGGSVTDDTAGSMFGRMDADGDGKVTLDELTAYLQTSPS